MPCVCLVSSKNSLGASCGPERSLVGFITIKGCPMKVKMENSKGQCDYIHRLYPKSQCDSIARKMQSNMHLQVCMTLNCSRPLKCSGLITGNNNIDFKMLTTANLWAVARCLADDRCHRSRWGRAYCSFSERRLWKRGLMKSAPKEREAMNIIPISIFDVGNPVDEK